MFARPSLSSIVTTLAAATILVGGADLASYAATGQPLTLGHSNFANRTTSLSNTGSGPALSLHSSAGSPSLTLNSSRLIAHLNADRLDGLDGARVQNLAHRYGVPRTDPLTTESVLTFPGLPPGLWMASYSVVVSATSGVQCFFRQASPVTAEAFATLPGNTFGGMNASAVIDTRGSHGPVTFHCQGSSYYFYTQANDVESTITFNNLTSVVNDTTAAARTSTQTSGRITGNR